MRRPSNVGVGVAIELAWLAVTISGYPLEQTAQQVSCQPIAGAIHVRGSHHELHKYCKFFKASPIVTDIGPQLCRIDHYAPLTGQWYGMC